ncbi:competence type IV pilus minor pilin ComGE [Metabacillus fastidiosus]|uniref:competence type IV pilus minor pilin ComGE n=1 Tax=Metabacillus fastidiosus TaxID=1458 RepID=UPI003D2E6DF9
MLRNCKGFSLAETLTALGIWSILLSIIIPQMMVLVQERRNVEQMNIAYKIIHEKTEQVIFHHAAKINEKISMNGVDYELNWREGKNYSKGCITWTNNSKQEKEVCLSA